MRGPRWGSALRVYVQAHRSGIFKRNLNVYKGVYGPLGSNFM